jgi:hypothetical protein
MILFVANATGTTWQVGWRQFSCRYLASEVNAPSGVTGPDWTSIDALLGIGGVKFLINRGQGSVSTPPASPRSDALVTDIAASVGVAIANNANNASRPISGINVNVEPEGATNFVPRVGPGVDVAMPADGFDWASASAAERLSMKREVVKSFPGTFTLDDTVSGGSFVGTQPTWAQAHQALVNWYVAGEDAIRVSGGTPTGLLVSQWWKSPVPIPFFGAGWWGSGAYPSSSCSTTQQWSLPCRAFTSRHDWLGRRSRDYNATNDAFVENTDAPDATQWANNGWAAAVDTYAEDFFANSAGVVGTADAIPLQWYSMPYTEAETAANLDVATTNGFARSVFANRYQPVAEMVEALKANIRATWRAGVAQYGTKAALGLRWMTDSNSPGWLGSWCPPDLWREIVDHAFEVHEGSVAPKSIALWSGALLLEELFQSGTGTPSAAVAASRRVTLQRFAGRSGVGVDWDVSSSQGKEWRFALASMFDEDTHERVLAAKGCVQRARTRHAARASTLDAGGIVIGQ